MKKHQNILVKGSSISVLSKASQDYISLTDITKPFGDYTLIYHWMRNRNTVEFLGLWEILNNPDFKGTEFGTFKNQAGLNNFTLTPKKWIEATNALGFISKPGRHGGGTYAHKDIAFEFASWISPEFKLYLIKEFQRLKEDENKKLALGWDVKRMLAKINYRIHTDAIKEHLIPENLSQYSQNLVYANEADLLNLALFGLKAQDWERNNPQETGNIRDHAKMEQLVILANLETLNAEFIRQGLPSLDRLKKLNEIAIIQMRSLLGNPSIKLLHKNLRHQ